MRIIGNIPFFGGTTPFSSSIFFKSTNKMGIIRKNNPNNIFALMFARLKSIVLYIKTPHLHNCAFCVINTKNNKFQLTNNAKDRKSTRLNSSHVAISYAVFCLKKKKNKKKQQI